MSASLHKWWMRQSACVSGCDIAANVRSTRMLTALETQANNIIHNKYWQWRPLVVKTSKDSTACTLTNEKSQETPSLIHFHTHHTHTTHRRTCIVFLSTYHSHSYRSRPLIFIIYANPWYIRTFAHTHTLSKLLLNASLNRWDYFAYLI